ncbi:MAG: DUF4252 domain-containing protein [Phaeodactylibacter sp.]|nr:DUF4252 domain-containing protein [Phaeodactylibacter sp.]
MRFPILLFCVFAFALTSCSSPKTSAQFYQTHKKQPGVVNFKLPGWVMWLGGGIVYNSLKDEEAKVALKYARKIGKLRMLASENGSSLPESELKSFVSHIQKSGYEDLIQVDTPDSSVRIMARDRKDKIKNLMLLVRDEEGFVFMDMKSRIKYSEISDLINYFIQMGEKEEEQEDGTPKEEKKGIPMIPRV